MALTPKAKRARFPRLLPRLGTFGPGLVTAASDNDPTTVGALVAVAAATVYRLSWLTLLIFPMLAIVQCVGHKIGHATGSNLQQLARTRYGTRWAGLLCVSVVAVNVVTIAADLSAGAASAGLLVGLNGRWLVLPFAGVIAAVLVAGVYTGLERILKVVTLGFLAYVAAAVLAKPNWHAVFQGTFVPSISATGDDIQGALALLGTTLTGYVFVWASIAEAQVRPPRPLRRTYTDVVSGSAFVTCIFWFILITTAATLGVHHQPVNTVGQAAAALTPLAGAMAGTVFAVALVASSVLALPILIATTAYVLGAHFQWRYGLVRTITDAPAFYVSLLAALFIGALASALGIAPITILVAGSIAGGLGTPVALVFLLKIATDHQAMNGQPLSPALRIGGWAVTTILSALGLCYLGHLLISA